MQVVGHVNKLSPEFRETLKNLTEPVSYRMLTGTTMIDSETGDTQIMFGSSKAIPLHDRIKDPVTGAVVEIGIPLETDGDKVTAWKKFWIAAEGQNRVVNGKFTLNPGNIDHEEAYWFLQLANLVKDNAHRDKRIAAELELIKVSEELQAEGNSIDLLTKALTQVGLMDAEDIQEFSAVQGFGDRPVKDLKVMIQKFAQKYPKEFLEKQGDPNIKKKERIARAFEKNIIAYQPFGEDGFARVVWGHNGKTIAKLSKEDGDGQVEGFFNWTKQTGNGEQILKAIVKQLAGQAAGA